MVRILQAGFAGLLSATVFSFAQNAESSDSTVSSSVRYLEMPANVAPLDGLLPSGGIGQSNSLMSSPRNIIH